MRDVCAQMPTGVDVLITHGPPHSIRDECPSMPMDGSSYEPGRWVSVGCEVLRDELNRIKPKVHIFGHIHEGAGREVRDYDEQAVTFINAAVCDRNYDVTNAIQVVTLG